MGSKKLLALINFSGILLEEQIDQNKNNFSNSQTEKVRFSLTATKQNVEKFQENKDEN